MSILEDLVFLSINDYTGEIFAAPSKRVLSLCMIGATLYDLRNASRIDFIEGKEVSMIDTSQMEFPILDEIVTKIAEAGKQHSIKYWLLTLPVVIKKIRKRTMQLLIEAGKIAYDEQSGRFTIIHPEEKQELLDILKQSIIMDREPNPRVIQVLSVARWCGVLKLYFSKKERREYKKKVDALIINERIQKNIHQIISQTSSS
jgi:hypothetical protein